MVTFSRRVQMSAPQSIMSRLGFGRGGKKQKFVDSEIIRLSKPYTPFLSGTLSDSGTARSVFGVGKVTWKTPYATRQYYENRGAGHEGTIHGGRRGKQWAPRMWVVHGEEILRGAERI